MSRVHGALASSFKDASGRLVEYFAGDLVADEHVELLESWGALVRPEEEHLSPEERMQIALGIEPAPETHTADVDEVPCPAGGTPAGDRVTGDYASATAERLQVEIDARTAEGRTIEVTGTGQGGNVLKGDLVAALDADDDTGRQGG